MTFDTPHHADALALAEPVAPTTPATAAAAVHEAPPAAPGAAFAALALDASIVRAIVHAGYEQPTTVQQRTVPLALAGHDLLVSSQTGSGKTAAFVWPALQRLIEARRDPAQRRAKGAPQGPRVLVLAPTRELALQVWRACTVYGQGVQGLRVASVVGGVPYHAQLKALRGPLDILVATPGRLLDLMGSGAAVLAHLELLVLDEADRMLDMGFIDDISAIAQACPAERQTLMFSATFAGQVGGLAAALTRQPRKVAVDSHTDTHSQIAQRLYWADNLAHKQALLEELLTERDIDQCVVFTSTQQDADVVAWKLADIGHAVAALHGGMPQGRRNRVLQGLRQGHLRILVATDVAARGIDVPSISHVINFGLPMKPEDYVHRIGRTGRAGNTGLAITLAERRDIGMVRRIERFTTQKIASAVLPGFEPKLPEPAAAPRGGPAQRPRFGGPGRPGGRPGGGGFVGHGGHHAGHGDAWSHGGPPPLRAAKAPHGHAHLAPHAGVAPRDDAHHGAAPGAHGPRPQPSHGRPAKPGFGHGPRGRR